MLQHLVLKTRRPLSLGRRPLDWQQFIHDKSDPVRTLSRPLDQTFADAGLGFWVTQEHKSRTPGTWSKAEVAAGLDRLYRVILHTRAPSLPRALLDRVRVSGDVEYVRPRSAQAMEIVQSRAQSPRTRAPDPSREMLRLREAHLLGVGAPGIKVAVLDTGLDLRHPELAGRVGPGIDLVELSGLDTTEFIGDFVGQDDVPEDEVGHGTHVAGIVAGRGSSMPGGVAPSCVVMPVRVLATISSQGKVFGAGIPDNISAGIKWAVDHGADVINLSLGVRYEGGGLPHEEVIRYALSSGVTVVAASGNDGTDQKYYPGALPGVIAVGACDELGEPATFTSYGAPVWMQAPGTNILSSFASGRYAMASGTSQAAPFVSGAVALLKAQAKSLGASLDDAQVKRIFEQTSDRADSTRRTARVGCGTLNILDASRLLHHTFDRTPRNPRATVTLNSASPLSPRTL